MSVRRDTRKAGIRPAANLLAQPTLRTLFDTLYRADRITKVIDTESRLAVIALVTGIEKATVSGSA